MSGAEGGCICGALRYEVKSQPERITICHCKFCQRATGSAFLVEPIFQQQDFSLIKGEVKTYQHRSTGSGKLVDIHFCDTCGTKLYLTFERFADVVGIYGGTFDDPNWFERTAENTKHIFLAHAQHGTVIPAGIATYQQHATTNEGAPIKPTIYKEPKTIRPHK